jgi:hypothetical protein
MKGEMNTSNEIDDKIYHLVSQPGNFLSCLVSSIAPLDKEGEPLTLVERYGIFNVKDKKGHEYFKRNR